MKTFDNIIIGSGINGLVAASVLAKKGRKVLLLERNEQIGGCIRSDEATEPGFVHDVMATTFVLFITSPAYAVLADDLHARGLEFCQPEFPSGVLMDDGRSCVISMNADDIAHVSMPLAPAMAIECAKMLVKLAQMQN